MWQKLDKVKNALISVLPQVVQEINMYLSVIDDGISYWVMPIFGFFKERSQEQVEICLFGITSDFEPKKISKI